MNPKHLSPATIDEQGRLVLPPELAARYGLAPGAQVFLEPGPNELRLLRPAEQLNKLFIEPTNACNLDCVTCMRNVWDEPLGKMSAAVFGRILEAVRALAVKPAVSFMGIGEPLAHAHIVEMIAALKAEGCFVELTTNGTLLDEAMTVALTHAGLDRLWVSLDGATAEAYADVRLGSSLPQVIENLGRVRLLRHKDGYQHDPRPQLGVAFVAMKRNIHELPAVLRLGAALGVKYFSVSNVLAHTPELREEILYTYGRRRPETLHFASNPIVNLPRLDVDEHTREALLEVWSRKLVLLLAGKEMDRSLDACQFIEQGATAIRWDGAVCPCPPLLHTHDSYLEARPRRTQAAVYGSLREQALLEIWNDPAYLEFRRRVQQFDFSPCVYCNCCEMAGENGEDCVNSPTPSCGGCLWAQGFIQCP